MQFLMGLGESEEDDRIYFAGFVANVNSDILKLKLGSGFSIREVTRKECDDLLSRLERVSLREPSFESDIGQAQMDRQFLHRRKYLRPLGDDSWRKR